MTTQCIRVAIPDEPQRNVYLEQSVGLDIEWNTLVPFSGAVLVGGLIGSRYGSRVAAQRSVRLLLVAVLMLASGRRVLGLVGFWP